MRWHNSGRQLYAIIPHARQESFTLPVTISRDVHVLCLTYLTMFFS
jgi:hypothetical protein